MENTQSTEGHFFPMRLEEQFESEYDLISWIRRNIYVRSVRYKFFRAILITVSALLLYELID